ncbi:MAG TPA: glycosyltransferase family 39 protein, partial [Candidatus Acidoferrales bacterium]|nr:glycosyltransferase family 39 protein [Candidatus Acidoferrales bacterium]
MSASALYLVAIIVPYLAFAALMATLLVSRPLAALTLAIAAIAAILSVPSRWLLAAWIAAAAAVFVGSGSLLPLLVAACILLLAFSTGARAVRALTLDAGIPTAEFAAFAIVLGLGALSMVTLGLGLLGMLTPWPVLISLLAIAILGYGELRALLSAALQRVRRSPTGRGHAPRAVAILAVLLIVALVEVVAPELQYDALSYHLGLPREYVAAAAIVDRPEQPQSYYYLGMDMDLLLAMFLSGQTAARLLSFAYVLVGAVAMYSCGADLFSRRAGAIAAALYLATPMVGWEATTTYVDGAAATCGLLAAVAAIRARRDQSVRLAVLAGA